ncbi:MAG: GlsB/YeaQ/YmgE family stress response membrane protein [Peptoniphilus sp. oral taxon 375]|nr:GlsB/YeaQ/YmgE family stress response membrane protein [Peptoniphilus sp. oral taxon 375]
MGIISWIIFGAIAGWLASKVTGDDPNMGAGANIIVGIIGSFIGGFIGTNVFHFGKVSGFNLSSFLIAIAGSVILLLILGAIRKHK